MKVRYQQEEDADKYLEFNSASFPERGELIKKVHDFRYKNNLNPKGTVSENVLAFDDEGKIIGQALYHPSRLYFQGKTTEMQWGFDFFVRADKRNDLAGVHILEFVKANFKRPVFATGLGDKALKIQKYFGYRVIGSLRKYLAVLNPLYFITGLLREKSIPAKNFPAIVGRDDQTFKKVDASQLWDANQPYNGSLLEFTRDTEFLKWRFFSGHFNYALYKKAPTSGLPIYFVVRTVKIKGVTSLILVDFRCSLETDAEFKMIIEAASKTALKLFLPVLVTGSSHAIADKVLEEKKFKKIGRDRPIVSNSKEYTIYKDEVDTRKFTLVTLADSDGEYLL